MRTDRPLLGRLIPGVRMRAALAALAASALAFGVAAFWVGRAVHGDLERKASNRAFTAMENVWAKIPKGPDEAYQDATFVVMTRDGRWLRSNKLNEVYQHQGYGVGLVPIDPEEDRRNIEYDLAHRSHSLFNPVTLHFPAGMAPDRDSVLLKGRSVQFHRALTASYNSTQLEQYSGVSGLPAQRLTVYVMIDPQEADQAAATVTRVLGWYLAPGASLFVALMAWLATGLALRPVESIRWRMAEIGDGAYHQRVPVPRARDGIARLAVTTNVTLGKLERALAEQRRLVADASHELRSPLAALRSTLEVPLAHPAQADWPAVVAGALTDTERLQELADDLLLLARTEAATADGTVELHDLITEQLAERTHTDPGLAFRFEPAEATVPGREVLVGRILRNLLDNAAQHTATAVTVRLRTADGWAELTVDDDGPGIPPEDRERVFDRFVRLDTDRNRATGGAGLGLALVRTIARSLGGSAAAEEPPGGDGGHLVVRLPLAG